MSEWYVKEFAKLAGVTVQTLHYYDKQDLLKPSVRRANGYRMYSQADLIRLQHIIALRFVGFGLSQIKDLLAGAVDVRHHVSRQVEFLEERARVLRDAAQNLKRIAELYDENQPSSWKTILQMIEVYHMVQQFEKTWLGKVLTKTQLERVVKEFGNVPEREQQAYSKAWDVLVAEVAQHIAEDPYGPQAQSYAKRWMDLVNKYFSDRETGEAIWSAYKRGDVPVGEAERAGYPYIPQNVVVWIDKAVSFMYSGKKK